MRSTRRCSSTPSWSRSETGRSPTGPVYAAIGVTLAGEKDILGLWAGTGGEGAKFWMSVLTDLKNRGVRDVFFVVCDGLKGLPEVVGNAWPQAIVQTCIVHLIRNTFRLASKRDWDALKRDVKPIYTAVNAEAARAALDELAEKWGQRYPAIIRLWRNAWEQFIPFLDYDIEIRKVLCIHQRDRVAERPLPPGGQGQRPLPDRAGRAQVPLPGHPVPGPDRDRPHHVGDAVEARPERLRDNLRRPVPRPPRPTNPDRRKHRWRDRPWPPPARRFCSNWAVDCGRQPCGRQPRGREWDCNPTLIKLVRTACSGDESGGRRSSAVSRCWPARMWTVR